MSLEIEQTLSKSILLILQDIYIPTFHILGLPEAFHCAVLFVLVKATTITK